jgi:hypothetical protein
MGFRAVHRHEAGRAMCGMVLVVALGAGHPGADRDCQVRDQAMTAKLIVVVTLHDEEVSRFETVVSSKEKIAFVYDGFEHILKDEDTITFRMPLALTLKP